MIDVLVTGAKGQLASCIRDLEAQYRHLNFIYADASMLDICDVNQVLSFFKAQKSIDYCINCAAYTAVDKAENEQQKAFQINAEGPRNLARVCVEFKATLLHVSTDFVFDGESDKPYVEHDIPNPISVYGASKLKGEEAIKEVLKRYFIFRTSWLYSEHGNNFMKTMLRLAETRDTLGVVSDQIGAPTYAKDLAKVLLDVIDANNNNYGLYHYSNGGITSWYDFAKEIFKLSNTNITVNPITTLEYPTPARRPKYSVLDKSKVKQILSCEIQEWEMSLKVALTRL
ncbi:dTDP-4-dehydrorhamnose reductase [Tamlana haliotis]|uniref:dTDP-4-dehydrorhamnose reductase n=1 Tax=Pseudotamlana haliotis TaxID=2614804 RepID=A0A6N6MBK9_9FLAO|nr:dTDP-4-dehydrorhamnose reductase [Tamlana haliotis]KAB1066513.1 dTDP-4-dehydrorhamnose reductase [Tamlana haliotis]